MEKNKETNIYDIYLYISYIYLNEMPLKFLEEKYLSSNCIFTESKRKLSNSVMLGAFVPQN